MYSLKLLILGHVLYGAIYGGVLSDIILYSNPHISDPNKYDPYIFLLNSVLTKISIDWVFSFTAV